MLLIITSRPTFEASWAGQAHATTVHLARLNANNGAALVERVADGKRLPDEVLEQILTRTDGVPLFMEELTKTVLESGLLRKLDDKYVLDGPLPPKAIPTTLHGSLLARLDRLAGARKIAQVGAAIGREFSYELLRALVPLSEQALDATLSQLVVAELMFRSGSTPLVTYTFKHALVQDVAYDTLLRKQRQELHAEIASVLEARFPDVVAHNPNFWLTTAHKPSWWNRQLFGGDERVESLPRVPQ